MVINTAIANLKQPLVKQQGISLIELMISMVIGLILLAGVIGIFLSSQQAYRAQEASSRVQESGRFALDIIAHDARLAGYTGCGSNYFNNILDKNDQGYNPTIHSIGSGFSAVPDSFTEHIDGDVLTIKYMNTKGVFNVSQGSNPAEFHVKDEDGNRPDIKPGQIVMVVNLDGLCEIFQNTSTQPGVLNRGPGGNVNVSPGNRDPDDREYTIFIDNVELFELVSTRYYINESEHNTNLSLIHI